MAQKVTSVTKCVIRRQMDKPELYAELSKRLDRRMAPPDIATDLGIGLPEVTRTVNTQEFKAFRAALKKQTFAVANNIHHRTTNAAAKCAEIVEEHMIDALRVIYKIMTEGTSDSAQLRAAEKWLALGGITEKASMNDNRTQIVIDPTVATLVRDTLNEVQTMKPALSRGDECLAVKQLDTPN